MQISSVYNKMYINNTNANRTNYSKVNFEGNKKLTKKIANAVLTTTLSLVAVDKSKKSASTKQEEIPDKTNLDIVEVEPPDGTILEKVPEKPIITNPAQLSILHMHDFHGQSIRMERAHTIIKAFDDEKLNLEDDVFDRNKHTDKLKLSSGDMFMGTNPDEIKLVNEFLNLAGFLAITLGNHEFDSKISEFINQVKSHKYKIVSTNIHPNKQHGINKIRTGSFIVNINGNKYGIIGATPIDIMEHTKIPEEVSKLHVDNLKSTINEIELDINQMKKNKVNKIILLSHLGIDIERYIAQNVCDIDIILGGHTHTLFKNVKEGQNLFYSPKGEPVLILQAGKDGKYISAPNIKFNEYGQIIGINYNIINTDDFERSKEAKEKFEHIIKPVILGEIEYVETLPDNLYINENPNCNFILDCIRKELNTDIAIMNASPTRNTFSKGQLDLRELNTVSQFHNKVVIIELSEKEIISAIQERANKTMLSSNNKPGLLQVSGLEYEIDKNTGNLLSLKLIDKNGNKNIIAINNPSEKMYTVAIDDFCAKTNGKNIENHFFNPIKETNLYINDIIMQSLMKQKTPIQIKMDGRIKTIETKS